MKKPITSKQYFLTLNTTYYLQAFSVLLFAVVVAFLIKQRIDEPTSFTDTWTYIIPLVTIVSLVVAYLIFKLMIDRIKAGTPLKAKMPVYAKALIVRSALLEMPGFLAAIAAYLTAQIFYLGASALIFIVFVLLRPTRNTITNDLKLSRKESVLLDDENAVIAEVESR